MFGVLFTIHADAYRKVRAMQRHDEYILRKILRTMAVTAVAFIVLLSVFLWQVIAGTHSAHIQKDGVSWQNVVVTLQLARKPWHSS